MSLLLLLMGTSVEMMSRQGEDRLIRGLTPYATRTIAVMVERLIWSGFRLMLIDRQCGQQLMLYRRCYLICQAK